MEKVFKPIVYISYTWTRTLPDGRTVHGPDERAEELAEKLFAAGIDARIDIFFHHSKHGFEPPEKIYDNSVDPWIMWAGDQIEIADCVLLFCTSQYALSDPDRGNKNGKWDRWHNVDRSLKDIIEIDEKIPKLWWDWHFMVNDILIKSSPRKLIPVGYGSYNPNNIPGFIRGAAYYNLESEKDYQGLLNHIRKQWRLKHPRQGVFISYSHRDEPKWLDKLLLHLKPLERSDMKIWTDKEIEIGEKFHDSIQNALSIAKVAILMVSPYFLASSYVLSHELPTMLQAANAEGLTIFWIPIKPSNVKETDIWQFQAAHPPDKPLSELSAVNLKKALENISLKLKDYTKPGIKHPSPLYNLKNT